MEAKDLYIVCVRNDSIVGCYEDSCWTVNEGTYYSDIERAIYFRDKEVQRYIKEYQAEICNDPEELLDVYSLEILLKRGDRKSIIGISKVSVVIDPKTDEEKRQESIEAFKDIRKSLDER